MSKKALIILSLVLLAGFQTAYAAYVPSFDADAKTSANEKLTPFDAKMRQAFAAIDHKDWPVARAALDAAIKLDPRSIDPYLAQAEIARLTNQPKAVESALKKALDMAPKNPDSLSAWSRLEFARGDFDAAESYLRRAIEAKPDYARLHIDLADIYLNTRHNASDAVTEYRRAIQLDQKSAGAQVGLGSALLAQGDKPGAVAAFERAAILAPKAPQPQIGLARIYASERRYQEAARSYAKALTLQEGMVGIMIERADVLLLDGRTDDAVAAYRDAAKAAPKMAAIPAKLGMALQQSGKVKEAFAAYEQALSLDGKSAVVFNNLAALSAQTGERLAEAPTWAKRAVELDAANPNFLDTQAWVLQASGKAGDALKALDQAVPKMPDSALLHYRRGLLLEETGKPADAVNAYRRALQIDPAFDSAKDANERIGKLSRK